MKLLRRTVDVIAASVVTIGAPLFRTVGNWPGNYPLFRKAADKARVHWRSTHYYQPTYAAEDLPEDVSQERALPGLDLFPTEQLQLLAALNYQSELAELAVHADPELAYRYDNGQYGAGDADALYSMVRHFKPKRIFEIGSGNSTRVAAKAIARNMADDPAYACRHLCIEPYEMPWLERLGPEIIRKRVEDVPLELFAELEAGDIFFIDSSHVIRPFGDVLVEFLDIVPRLPKGVLVHVHDIFTPRDYPEKWLREDRRLWNEQYLMEAMLAHSPRYKTRLALNWLQHNHRAVLDAAFPILQERKDASLGAYWFEVVE